MSGREPIQLFWEGTSRLGFDARDMLEKRQMNADRGAHKYDIHELEPGVYELHGPSRTYKAWYYGNGTGFCSCQDFIYRCQQVEIPCKHLIMLKNHIDDGKFTTLPEAPPEINISLPTSHHRLEIAAKEFKNGDLNWGDVL